MLPAPPLAPYLWVGTRSVDPHHAQHRVGLTDRCSGHLIHALRHGPGEGVVSSNQTLFFVLAALNDQNLV